MLGQILKPTGTLWRFSTPVACGQTSQDIDVWCEVVTFVTHVCYTGIVRKLSILIMSHGMAYIGRFFTSWNWNK